MFTSRGPRNRAEIAACVSFYRHSPLWTELAISEEQVIECWEALLDSGIGGIDIIEHTKLSKDLKNPRKAVVHPHFEHGFIYVDLFCYLTLEVARDILKREDDSVDAFLYFSTLCLSYLQDNASLSPLPEVDADSRVVHRRLTVFSSGVYHSDIVNSYSLRTFKYLFYKYPFTRRAFDSVVQACIGVDHDAALITVTGQYLVAPYKRNGLRLAQEFSGNAQRPASEKNICFA